MPVSASSSVLYSSRVYCRIRVDVSDSEPYLVVVIIKESNKNTSRQSGKPHREGRVFVPRCQWEKRQRRSKKKKKTKNKKTKRIAS
jgi:hypothetical protein